MFITPSLLLIGLAIFMAAICIPAILSPEKWQKEVKKIVSNESLVRILSLFAFLVSFLFLSLHFKFTGGWLIIIPIVGWLVLLKALVLLWFPALPYEMAKKTYLHSEGATALISFIGLVIAIGLTYVALYQL
ncbi:MAG: hypothetical protein WC604_05140 [Candidatus Gracilibacteria bacterium]